MRGRQAAEDAAVSSIFEAYLWSLRPGTPFVFPSFLSAVEFDPVSMTRDLIMNDQNNYKQERFE
jgi:hypothetical protein